MSTMRQAVSLWYRDR